MHISDGRDGPDLIADSTGTGGGRSACSAGWVASGRLSGKTWRVRDGSERGRLVSLRNTNSLADGKDACSHKFASDGCEGDGSVI